MNENKNLAPAELSDELLEKAGGGTAIQTGRERCVCGFAGYGCDI